MKNKILNELRYFEKDIYDKVINPIITLNKPDIHDLYKNQRDHFDENESAQSFRVDILKSHFDEFKDSQVLGIDLPLWIDWNDEKKQKLMIVGRDPQRSINNIKNDKDKRLIIGSPYSLASKGGRDAKNNYWSFIEPLTENSRLYITDIYKLFIVNTAEKVKKLRGQKEHFSIFTDELNLISPDKIITIGKDAADAVKKYILTCEKLFARKLYDDLVYEVTDNETKRKIIIYFIPHISGQVTSGIVTIANLYKSIGKLRDDINLQSAGENIFNLKERLFNR
mgnify:CR=1 FL=1